MDKLTLKKIKLTRREPFSKNIGKLKLSRYLRIDLISGSEPRPSPQKWGLGSKFFTSDPPRPSKWGYLTLMRVGLGQRFWPYDPTRWPSLKKKLKFEIKIIYFKFYLFSAFEILLTRILSLFTRSHWLSNLFSRMFLLGRLRLFQLTN